MKFKVGIIGAGWIGTWHAERWRRLPVDLTGFYDLHADAAQTAVQRFGGRSFASVEALCAAVDIVHICSPTPHHHDHALVAAAARKHVICEKPLARTLSDADAIIQACDSAGVRLFVGQVLRFFPQYARARQLVLDDAIGTPSFIRLLRAAGHPSVNARRNWFKAADESGGVMLEGGIHDLDYARWVMGEVEQVFARGLTYDNPTDLVGDHALVTLRFASGALGQVEGSWLVTDGRFRQRFEIGGSRGLLQYDSLPAEPFTLVLRDESRPALLPAEPMSASEEPYAQQLWDVLDCLAQDREFRVSPHDGREALRLSIAVLESMRTGRAVRVAEVL